MISQSLKRWNRRFGPGLPPSSGMKEALQWLMLARLCVLYLVLAVMVVQQVFRGNELSPVQRSIAWGLFSICFAFNLFHSLCLEKIPSHWGMGGLQVLFDSVATSLWIYYGGGPQNLFALLYLIQILVVSLILYQKGALCAAIFSSLGFGTVIFFAPHAFGSGLSSWLTYSTLFLTIGIVGGYLSEELFRASQSLKEKQNKIEKLTQLHERILTHMPTGLLTVNREMRINFMNPSAASILGLTAEWVIGKPLEESAPELLPFFSRIDIEDVDVPTGSLEAALSATGDEHHRSFFVQTRARHARLQQRVEIGSGPAKKILRGDVAELDAEAGLGSLLEEEASGGRVLLFQDVTTLLYLEERLKQNEKLAAVGQLAAGIAHEIRNPLASMSASIELLKGSLPSDTIDFENHKLMEIALREIDRLNRLVSEFLDYVKPEKFKPERVLLREVLSEVVLSAKKLREFKAGLQIVEKYSSDAASLASPGKLKQVIWNLLANAIQSMNHSGTIEVGCETVEPARVRFWIQDEGAGMSEEVLHHLYEPFFTTKDKGTGLGLATAYKIIEAHQGEIRVESQHNRGTRFDVFLPCYPRDAGKTA